MPPVGLEPTISAGERPQTYSLDSAATGAGWRNISTIYIARLASNEIFSQSDKIHREVGRAKDLSALRYIYIYLLQNQVVFLRVMKAYGGREV